VSSSGRAAVPSALAIQIAVTSVARLRTKTIWWPLGDHFGEKSFGPTVIWVRRNPSALETKSALWPAPIVSE
jgi:hypothetical protein